MSLIFKMFFIFYFISYVKCVLLPVEKCNLKDSACLLREYQKSVPIFYEGIPEYNIEHMDEMKLDDIAFDLSGLKFSLKEGRLKGLKNSVIETVKWDVEKKTFDVVFVIDCTAKGHYTASGKVIVMPISGDGDMELTLKKLSVHFHAAYDIIHKKADGKDYVSIKKYEFDYEVKENAHFYLTNLFNGNKQLSDTVLTFLNDNWQQVSAEFGTPTLAVVAKKIFKNMQNFFNNVAISDIAIME